LTARFEWAYQAATLRRPYSSSQALGLVRAFTVTPTHLGFEDYDVAIQIAFSHHYWVIEGQLEKLSAPFRYVWPSELDLMARLPE